MADIGTATVRVVADTSEAERSIRRLRGVRSWPDVGLVAVTLGFVGFVIEKVF